MPFINLNAMAMMGVGVLGGDYRLFSLAYKDFTGQEPSNGVLDGFKNKTLRIIDVLPRMLSLTGEMVDKSIIGKLFAAAA